MQTPMTRPATASERNARANRRAWRIGMSASLLFHLLVFLLWRGAVPPPGERALGPRTPTGSAGGGALQALSVRIPERREIPPPPEPIPAVDVPEVEIRDVAAVVEGPSLAPVPTPGRLPGLGGGTEGTTGGEGGTAEDYVSPVPRSVLPYWDPPGSVRGMEVTVRVYVDATGRPTGAVELDPPTPDRGFNREIMDRVRAMEYRPATRAGEPVAGWAEITFIF